MTDGFRATLSAALLTGLMTMISVHAEPPANDPVRTTLEARGAAAEVADSREIEFGGVADEL